MKRKHRVWRLQRSTTAGDVVSAMTHDRQYALHFPIDPFWELNFDGRFTFYAEAVVDGQFSQPRLRILRQATEEDWR